MVSVERIGYSPPQDSGENDNHQAEAAYADSGDDGEVIVVHSLALRRFYVFAVGLEIDLQREEKFMRKVNDNRRRSTYRLWRHGFTDLQFRRVENAERGGLDLNFVDLIHCQVGNSQLREKFARNSN